MLNYYYAVYFSYSIAFAAIIGLIRFKKIHKSYQPFILFVCLAFSNEILSSILIEIWKNNSMNGNLYVLFESLILIWLFKGWGRFPKMKVFYVLLFVVLLAWGIENIILNSIFHRNAFFRVFYALIIIFLSMEQINTVLFHERKNILKNSQFLICVIFLLYYTFKATYEVFYLIPIRMSNFFYAKLFLILIIINLFANLAYAIAILWIPKKLKFTLPY